MGHTNGLEVLDRFFFAPTSIRTSNCSASQQPSSYAEYANPVSFEGRVLTYSMVQGPS